MLRLAKDKSGIWYVILDDIVMFRGTEEECEKYKKEFESKLK